ncbi:MAG: molybdopterin-binding protein, partial [Thermodesulfovibrionales bacterium]|nr:molybdopterin-binding protein [Thermodesulfovibrionales bacterium]
MKREIYLETTPLKEATEKWLKRLESQGFLKPFSGEKVRVSESLGRITAELAIAKLSSPFYHSSAMDGYAVKYQETFGASETSPKTLKLGEQAVYIDTGDPMPDGFNAVIMIEDVNVYGNHIEITEPATPWQNVRVIGEDIVATELILPENHRIRPVDIGAMLAGGYVDINVRRKPRIVIIPTGTEIVEPGTKLKKGDIIEYNSRVLASLVSEWGGEAVRFRIVPDNLDELKDAILEAHKVGDMVVINAGASSGSKDFTSRAISEIGEVILHGVSIKPGKPVILGMFENKPVLGIPGYPVSAFITFNLFAKPVIYRWQAIEMEPPEVLRTALSRQVASTLGQEEFLRVKIGKVGDKFIATPVSRGAGVLMSLVRADGLVRIPAMSEGIGACSEVNVELLRTKNKIE